MGFKQVPHAEPIPAPAQPIPAYPCGFTNLGCTLVVIPVQCYLTDMMELVMGIVTGVVAAVGMEKWDGKHQGKGREVVVMALTEE
jgi:hypothetical protein